MPRFLKQLLIWTIVCGLSAAPSFIIALGGFDQPQQILAMLAGIGCFIVGYALVSCTAWAQRLRRRPFVMTAFKIGYGTRILLSAVSALAFAEVLPAVIADLWVGYISFEFVTDTLGFDEGSIKMVFMTTIVVGTLWNAALAVYILLIYGVQLVFRRRPAPSGTCEVCGYDLRASTGMCPECGSSIPSPPLAA